MATKADKTQVDPMALTVDEAARVLSVKAVLIEADLEAGAPVNPDGTLNLVHYAAWLNAADPEEPDVEDQA